MQFKINLDEGDIWKRMLKGEEAALEKIYRLYHMTLFQYGMRILSNEEMVKDCLHDLFVKVWVNRKHLSHTDNIKSYLLSSFRNLLFNYKSRKLKFEHVEPSDDNHFDLLFNLESAYIQKEHISQRAKNLSLAMNKLTPRQKEIIFLKYFEEMEFNEIAEIMGLTTKGAYKLSARALESLREIMQIETGLLVILLIELKKSSGLYYHPW